MAITRENVEYIANLARLDPKGKGFDKIAERKNAMREDEVVPSYDKEEILANAPSVACGGVSVPRVVE